MWSARVWCAQTPPPKPAPDARALAICTDVKGCVRSYTSSSQKKMLSSLCTGSPSVMVSTPLPLTCARAERGRGGAGDVVVGGQPHEYTRAQSRSAESDACNASKGHYKCLAGGEQALVTRPWSAHSRATLRARRPQLLR